MTVTPFVYNSARNRYYVMVNTECLFNCSGSSDNESSIVKYEWDFDCPAGFVADYYETPDYYPDGYYNGVTSHTYTSPGIYTVFARVWDSDASAGYPPDKSGTAYCQVVVFEIDLDISGVDDGDEYSPGGFVSYNGDDDDEDNEIDRTEEYDAIDNEDNLVTIDFSITPSGSADFADGEIIVELNAPLQQTDIRVWKNANRGDSVVDLLLPKFGVYSYEWSDPYDAPAHAYVEGYVANIGVSKLALELRRGASTYFGEDQVRFHVVELKAYREGWGTLDDWPETATQDRSPKYIFGKGDPIYVQASNLDVDPGQQETRYDVVQVESDSGGSASLTLKEVDENDWKFTNTDAQLGELLYLADRDYEGSSDWIKVVDEEVLTFSLEIEPDSDNYVTCKKVMVDRGEFATGAGRSYDSKLADPKPPDRTPLWNDAADEFENDITSTSEGDLDWWDVGDVRGSYSGTNSHFNDLIENAGENLSDHLEADMFYAQCHGETDGTLRGTQFVSSTSEQKEEILDPSTDFGSSDWDDDLDWPIIKACDVLRKGSTGRALWQSMLGNSPRRVHGILSFGYGSVSDYADYVDDFMDEIGARHTIITSWINANTASFPWSDQPYSIAYHTENADDRLQSPAEGVSLTADVTTSNYSYAWRNESGQTGTDGMVGDIIVEQSELEAMWQGRRNAQTVRIGRAPNGLQSIHVKPHVFDIGVLSEQFTLKENRGPGSFKMSKDIYLSSEAVAEERAVEIAKEFLSEFSLRDKAVMLDPEPMHVASSDGASVTMAYIISFTNRHRGCVLAGDHITLIVQNDGVKTASVSWHDVDSEQGRKRIKPFTNRAFESSVRGLHRLYEGIRDVPKAQYVRPVYYLFNSDEQPSVVWDICFEGNRHVFWNPITGNSLNHFDNLPRQQ